MSANAGSISMPPFTMVSAKRSTSGSAIVSPRRATAGPAAPVILAGLACDSTDILYRRHSYKLPLDLAIGDFIDFLSAGALTTSGASIAFNGFPPIRAYFV